MKPPLTYYGGKQRLAKTIISLIPKHRLYCEPFFGGGAVFFAKEPSKVEIINDTNRELINFYKVIKTSFGKLQREVKGTLNSRWSHKSAEIILKFPQLFDEVKRAWAVWVMASQSYAARLDGPWNINTKTSTCVTRVCSKRNNFVKAYSERLENAAIECSDALNIIRKCDGKETFFYLDPPYHNAKQGHYSGYTEEHFIKLLEILSDIKGKFLLSSYPSDILDKYKKKNNWHSIQFEMCLSMSANPTVKKKKKIEVLTANFPLTSNHQQTIHEKLHG